MSTNSDNQVQLEKIIGIDGLKRFLTKIQEYSEGYTESYVSEYAPKKDGTNAIGNWPINITGTAENANKLNNEPASSYAKITDLDSYVLKTEMPSLTDCATKTWVADNYLSQNGGSLFGAIGISSGNDVKLILNNTDADDMYQCISFQQNGTEYGQLGTYGNDELRWVGNTLLHSGNYADYALPITGGTVNGSITANSFIGNLTGNADSATNADTLDGKHATDLVETIIPNKDSNSLDLNYRKSVHTWLSTGWAFEGSDKVLNQPWTSSAANVWTLPGQYPLQLARFYNSSVIKARGSSGSSTWTDWKDIAFTDSNVASATRLLAYTHDSGGYSLVSGTRTDGTLSRGVYDNGRALIYSSEGQGVNAEIATIDSNVASATKLQTARTIWGQSFDGTGDIPLSAIFKARSCDLLQKDGNRIGKLGNTTDSNNDLYLYTYDDSCLRLGAGAETDSIIILPNGNVGIGTTSPTSKLHVNGDVKATNFIGNLTGIASSAAVGTGTSDAYRAIVVTDGNNGLYTAGTAVGKPQYNYSTGDVKATSFTGKLIGNADSATKVNNSLKVGTKTYNGSSEVEITAADLGLAAAMKYCGKTSTALTDGATTNPVVINGSNHTATAGCTVISNDNKKEFVWNGSNWEELGDESSYKVKQTQVSSPTASGSTTAFIDTISQDVNGMISVTKKNVDFSSYVPKSGNTTISGTLTASGFKVGNTNVSLDGHTHSYLPTTGATHSGAFTIDSAGDLTLKASASTPDDPGDLVFANSSGAELARIYYLPSASKTVMRYGPSTTSYEILTSNTGAFKSHTHNWSDINDVVHAGNEFNFVPDGFINSLWFNYRSKTNTSAAIHGYYFGNGAGVLAPCHAANFITSSDQRLKKNITEIVDASKSLELGFYEFDYVNNDNHSAGHIAQEVREVLPEFVHGKETETEHLSVDYTGLHSVQIKALKDEVDTLKTENKELRERLEKLEALLEKLV